MIIQIQLGLDDDANVSELTRNIWDFFRNKKGINGVLVEKYIPFELEDDDEWETILDRDADGHVIVNDHPRKENK